MKKPKDEPDLQKHTFHLRAGDYEALHQAYPKSGAAKIIRRVVSQLVDKVINKPANLDELGDLDDDSANL